MEENNYTEYAYITSKVESVDLEKGVVFLKHVESWPKEIPTQR